MAYRSVEESSLTGIADAIRSAGETEESLLFPEGFQTAISNLGGKGAALTVTAPAGATVTASKDGKTLTRVAGDDGVVVFRGLDTGTWALSITDGSQTASKTVEIVTDYAAEISYNVIPEFTYTGDFEIVNDSDEPITVSQDNWKIRLLTSGTLTFQALNGAEDGVDVFLVGGGGSTTESWPEAGSADLRGGGGGGYTTTKKGVLVNAGTPYDIVVGAGASDGAGAGAGGTSTAFGQSAAGGSGTITVRYGGCAGGSGGGGRVNVNTTNYTTVGHGGSDGGDGYPSTDRENGGKGQGTTTREFGESGGKIYAGGGGGGTHNQWTPSATPGGYGGEGGGGRGGNTNCNPTPGEANTGGGGGGGIGTCAAGGSGIVVIRNKR